MQEFGGRKGKGKMLRLKYNLKNKPKSELFKKKKAGSSKSKIVFPPDVFGSVLPPEGAVGSQGGSSPQ